MLYINTVIQDLPTTMEGFVRKNEDGGATIVLNARHSYETRMRKYWHEVEHLEEQDMDSDETADQIEAKRHRK